MSLLDDLKIKDTDLEEWFALTVQVFPSQRGTTTKEIKFYSASGTPEDKFDFCLDFDKNNQPVSATPGIGFDKAKISKLNDYQKEANQVSGPTVLRQIFFSRVKVQGYFRIEDAFQIIEVPSSATKPHQEYVGGHPFILEVKFKGSANQSVRMLRAKRRISEIFQFLQLVVIPHLDKIDKVQFFWGMTMEASPKNMFLQEGYLLDGFEVFGDNFSNADGLEQISVAEPIDYFNERKNVSRDVLVMPANITNIFGSYESMTQAQRARCRKALYWFWRSFQARTIAETISYLSLIGAVESLLPSSNFIEDCKACNQPIFDRSIGAKFKDFFSNYAKGVEPKTTTQLYKLRSKLTHGNDVALFEDESFFTRMLPKMRMENDLVDLARRAVRIGIINWICDGKKA